PGGAIRGLVARGPGPARADRIGAPSIAVSVPATPAGAPTRPFEVECAGVLLNAALRASEQRLPRLASRAPFASWRWPWPTVTLLLACGAALPLVWLMPGRGSIRILRWARD